MSKQNDNGVKETRTNTIPYLSPRDDRVVTSCTSKNILAALEAAWQLSEAGHIGTTFDVQIENLADGHQDEEHSMNDAWLNDDTTSPDSFPQITIPIPTNDDEDVQMSAPEIGAGGSRLTDSDDDDIILAGPNKGKRDSHPSARPWETPNADAAPSKAEREAHRSLFAASAFAINQPGALVLPPEPALAPTVNRQHPTANAEAKANDKANAKAKANSKDKAKAKTKAQAKAKAGAPGDVPAPGDDKEEDSESDPFLDRQGLIENDVIVHDTPQPHSIVVAETTNYNVHTLTLTQNLASGVKLNQEIREFWRPQTCCKIEVTFKLEKLFDEMEEILHSTIKNKQIVFNVWHVFRDQVQLHMNFLFMGVSELCARKKYIIVNFDLSVSNGW